MIAWQETGGDRELGATDRRSGDAEAARPGLAARVSSPHRFNYRFAGGESPADCFDRTSAFTDSLMRQVARKDRDSPLVVTHGSTIRSFVMRFLHLSVEEFEDLANPGNCDVIEIGRTSDIEDPTHTSGRWASTGLKLRDH